MNLQLSKRILFTLFCLQISFAGSLDRAYELYLGGSYSESYSEYKSVYEEWNDRTSLYGMVNSLVMMKRYDEALILCRTVQDSILTAKETWILGLQDDTKKARSVLEKQAGSAESKAIILRSGGDGFFASGNFREAISWYEQAQQINRDTLTQLAITSATSARKSAMIQTVSVMGGPIIYSHDAISEQGNHYRYDRGSFLSAGTRWDIKKRVTIELEYNRFDASFGENRFGINRLYTSLDNSQGFPWTNTKYNLHDSLNRWDSEDPQLNWHTVGRVDTVTYLGQTISDTTWLLYKDVFMLDMEGFDTIIRFTPEKIFQNGIYTGFAVSNVNDKPFTLGFSANLSQSNMTNMNRGASLRIYEGHNLKYLTLGSHWYGTFTEKVGTIQTSPEIGGVGKKFSWRITPSYVFKLKAPATMFIPKNQISVETELGISGKHAAVSGSAAIGKRAFTAESSGKNVVTISLPHRFTGSLYGAVMPGSGRLSIFTLLKYENYEQLSRLIALGGISFTF